MTKFIRLLYVSRAGLLLLVFNMMLTGCTTTHLKRGTLAQGSTVTDLQFGMVLDNIAMLKLYPGALPWHIEYNKGTIATQQKIAPSFSYVFPAVTRSFGLSGEHAQQHNWDVVPELDPDVLLAIQKVYDSHVDDSWIREGRGDAASFSGEYKSSRIWVAKEDVASLTKLVIELRKSVKNAKQKAAAKSGGAGATGSKILVFPSGATPLL